MKTFITIIAVLAIALPVCAESTLRWDIESGTPDTINVYYKEISATAYSQTALAGGARALNLSTLGLSDGVRYEFYLTATEGASESAPSDIIRYTMPMPQQVIEVPADKRPVSITININ